MAKISHTAAFAHFGTKPKNVQWSWSARSEDGKTVVVTLWQDLFKRVDGKLVYERPDTDGAHLDSRPGFRELMDNLAWARDRCDGKMALIIAIPKDRNADPRSIAECFPSKVAMRLTYLDTHTGAYSAESI